jgi:ribosomal protein L31
MPQVTLRPNLYRMVRVVMSDGATFRVPSAVRILGDTLQLERDPHNHPVYLVRALACEEASDSTSQP